jgi:hypothetical protein
VSKVPQTRKYLSGGLKFGSLFQYKRNRKVEMSASSSDSVSAAKVRRFLWPYFYGQGTRIGFAMIIIVMLASQGFNVAGHLFFRNIVDLVSSEAMVTSLGSAGLFN